MTITIPSGRTLPLQAKSGGGFASSALDLGGGGGGTLPSANLLSDGFESQDLSTTNSDGFSWGAINRTSLVRQSPEGNPTVVYNGSTIYNELVGDPRDWTAKEGDICMRFRYPANDFEAEQRFDLGAPKPELWVRYWLRVPDTYYLDHDTGNNKFFALWMDAYTSTAGAKIVWELWPDGGPSYLKLQTESGDTNGPNSFVSDTFPAFVDGTTDRGKWMQIVYHVKASSSAGASDGFAKAYRRWADESTFTLVAEVLNTRLDIPTGGPSGFQGGFILGYHNKPFPVDTEYLVDKVEFSTEALI